MTHSPHSLDRLAIHTLTNKPWSIHQCIDHYVAQGIGGISIWKETVENESLTEVRQHLDDSGLNPISYVRGGFFTGATEVERAKGAAANQKVIEDASALGIPMIVLVCGATPGQTPQENFRQIREGIEGMIPACEAAGIRLAVEPLHPKYAGNRSAIASMKAANDLCDQIDHPLVGLAVDVYHVWWDLDLEAEIQRCARAGRLFAYHICDFKPDFAHPLLDRGLMGEGCVPLQQIDQWIHAAGFEGAVEVEIFSEKWWAHDQKGYLEQIVSRYTSLYI